jgi:hypothetical protein
MTDKSETSFAVVRFNERTYQSGGVVAVIKGMEAAQRTLNDFDWCQLALFPRRDRPTARNGPGEGHLTSTSATRSPGDKTFIRPGQTLRTFPMTIITISNRRRCG